MQLCEMHMAEGLIILVLSLIINYIKWFNSISKSIDCFLYDRDLHLWLFICCKTKLKKIYFLKKYLFFNKIYIICRKKCFYMEKSFIMKISFTEKNFFCREKYKWKYEKYMSHFRNIFYTENVCVTNKIQIFVKYIFILQKKMFWSLKNIFVKASL